jgi:post-segregation antitoxin (ccd killing protein)
MANVTIYLDDSLRERVRAADLPVSRICQRALAAELARHGVDRPDRSLDGQLTVDELLTVE